VLRHRPYQEVDRDPRLAIIRVIAAGRLRVVLLLDLTLVGGLVLVGWSAHSLGVLAEGADYLADAAPSPCPC
jgi:hypothetical protein